jgi:hypothetical protein
LKDPGFVFGFITNHFLATQVNGLLALPLIKPYNGIFEPVNLYWMDWDGQLEWYNLVLVIFYLAVIALGLGASWKRWRWIGLLPLAFGFGYALATAIGRFSGWRYDLPADWVWYFYFGIGFAELLLQAALLFGVTEEKILRALPNEKAAQMEMRLTTGARAGERVLQELFLLGIVFALIGSLPWLAENIASPHYTDQSQSTLEEKLLAFSKAPGGDEIKAFASQPDIVLQTGRILYPRFFSKNDGLASANPWPAYAFHDYPRIGFLLLNQTSTFVVFPTKKLTDFPHAADVIIAGCQRDGYVEARWVAFPDLDTVYTSTNETETCSPE